MNIHQLSLTILLLSITYSANAHAEDVYQGINGTLACPADSNATKINAGIALDAANPWPTDCINCISHAIMVTDPSVVGEMMDGQSASPPASKAWELRHLLTEISGSAGPGGALKDLLESFDADQSLNSFEVKRRPGVKEKIIIPWVAAAGLNSPGELFETLNNTGDVTDKAWSLAPFKLISIGYRPDLILRDIISNHAISGGEGRFIFQALQDNRKFAPFTIIFEYALPATSTAGASAWAVRYDALRQLPFGARYNAELEAITRSFTDRNPTHNGPNNVSIGQIRTNELMNNPWELREFRLAENGRLLPSTVKMNPDLKFNSDKSDKLIDFLNSEEFSGSFPTTVIPWLINGEPFLAGSSLTPFEFVDPKSPGKSVNTWLSASNVPESLRHRFASTTCNGCHGGDAVRTSLPSQVLVPNGFFITGFTHVDARGDRFANPSNAVLSEFLCSADLVERVRAMAVWRSPAASARLLAALPSLGVTPQALAQMRVTSERFATGTVLQTITGTGGLTAPVVIMDQRQDELKVIDQGIDLLIQNIGRVH